MMCKKPKGGARLNAPWWCGVCAIVLSLALPGHAADVSDAMPPFSWDTVPVYAHVGKMSDDFTKAELKFLAKRFDFITIEKSQAVRKRGNTEAGFVAAARGIKRRNPDAKVLFYWNGFLNIPRYQANESFPEDGHLTDRRGSPMMVRETIPTYDLSNKAVRDWWSDVAVKAARDGIADGIFIDALPQITAESKRRRLGDEKYEALNAGLVAMLEQTRQKLGPEKLMIYNGFREGKGDQFLATTDGMMIEHFNSFSSSTKEAIAKDLDGMQRAARQGKVVVMKAWPRFNWLDEEAMDEPRDKRVQMARQDITFPLACFLIAAGEHSYFCYTWGYQADHGAFEWYPEFDKPLGEPQGDAVRTGWTYQRDFKHASVFLDLETKTATIDWKQR